MPPDILDEESSSDVTIKEGENASLYCNANGHPVPRITWRRNDGAPFWLPSTSNYTHNVSSRSLLKTKGTNFMVLVFSCCVATKPTIF